MAKILLVEDDSSVALAIGDVLELEGHRVEHVLDGLKASELLQGQTFDLVILDLDLPLKSGLDVCRDFRQSGGNTPVLMLTGKSGTADRIVGLDCGADDYLPKPFDMRELSARLRALLRRPEPLISTVLTLGQWQVDLANRRVTSAGVELALLAKELSLLEFLLRHRGKIFSVDQLLNSVWHSESDSSEDAVRQCVARLRRKIDPDGEWIVTVKGVGYKVREQ